MEPQSCGCDYASRTRGARDPTTTPSPASLQLHTPPRGSPLALKSSPAAPLPSDLEGHLVLGEGLVGPAEQPLQEGGSEPGRSRVAEAERSGAEQHSRQPWPEASTSPAPLLPRPLP